MTQMKKYQGTRPRLSFNGISVVSQDVWGRVGEGSKSSQGSETGDVIHHYHHPLSLTTTTIIGPPDLPVVRDSGVSSPP